MLNRKFVEEVFNFLCTDPQPFLERVSNNVHWTVKGTHKMAGEYNSKKDLVERAFAGIGRVLQEGKVMMKIKRILVDGDYAVAEMESICTALNGRRYNNTYCWIVKFENGLITEGTAYVDSALVQQILDENL
ncbi:nuclear transport factor 2 family protein [Microbulbifer sp. GL-2]|uniref:nuclear transport factor 2 family protein n=1 Tax=Microbulbifer sp. GL-2 TaxID=2591606 RepID=UPI00116462C7|nr:nuclear transport factor 2 family protein [Microbulbifer sp. GL-2]BBM02074.1 ketosteroid isomerase [Microbulbifer sp. GL-2]